MNSIKVSLLLNLESYKKNFLSWLCVLVEASQLNPLCVKFFRENMNIYLHFVSFLHIDTTQVAEILTQIRQDPTYST